MPSQHKNPLLGWRPPAELSAWVRAEADRREIDYGVILTEAVESYRAATVAKDQTRVCGRCDADLPMPCTCVV